MTGKSQLDRLSEKAHVEMDVQTDRLAKKMRGELSADDAQNMSTADWHALIVRNWPDQQWRDQQAQRMGPVAFVQDAMRAHGLNPADLRRSTLTTPPTAPPMAPPDTEQGGQVA